VSPSAFDTRSIGRDAWLERIMGVSRERAARATATSALRWTISSTPIGATRNGLGSVRPSSSTRVSRSETSRSIRGTIACLSNAARLARIVAPVPAPPAM
jgi:hypothetical protein